MAENSTQLQIDIGATLTAKLESIEEALPKNFNRARFIQNCISVVNDNPDLKNKPKDLIYGLIKGARLGLDFANKECYLIPYGSGFQFQTDYKGEIKFTKAFSTRPIKDIYAKVIREGDLFKEKISDGIPTIDFEPVFPNNGNITGAFAVCLFEDGGMIYETMTVEDIQSVRNNYSKAKDSTAWKNSFDQMCCKTVLRRLTKHIDKNIDSVETLKAYEEGGDSEFRKQRDTSDIVKNPFAKQEEVTEEVIDVESKEVVADE